MNWTAIAALVTAFSTVVLALVTWRYVRLTARLAASAEMQMTLERTPNLYFTVRDDGWRLSNLGAHSVFPIGMIVNGKRYDGESRWEPLQNWKVIVPPHGYVRVTKDPDILPQGDVLVIFEFVYGTTGATIHRLELSLCVEGNEPPGARIVSQRVHSQPFS